MTPFSYEGWSARAQLIYKRTYARPIDEASGKFEEWPDTVGRVINHQAWLWERAQGHALEPEQIAELEELRSLLLNRQAYVAGRTLWLGGTDISKRREVSQFNCAAEEVETVYDVVDFLWCLLNGAGVGGKPRVGLLHGFSRPIADVEVVRSRITLEEYNAGVRGRETNEESYDPINRTWTISVGDSSEAWAKAIGKLMAGKYPADKLVLDFSQLRPQGVRLHNYGWICSGDENISKAMLAITGIMNRRADQLLSKIDIMDILNWLGTSLSSRRSAQIMLVDYGDPEWEDFALAKKDYWKTGNPQRGQSNNSIVFWDKPSKAELRGIFAMMQEAGGSEPGFINGHAAIRRAPWFRAVNPCSEILLTSKSFCNLVEIVLPRFKDNVEGLFRALYVMARANYRQTCVNLHDGVLQEAWHLNNEFLRLTGVGLTGITACDDWLTDDLLRAMRKEAKRGVNSMADELGMPRSKLTCTIKPSGTISKVSDCEEGAHKPLAKYIFNKVVFPKGDPLLERLTEAGYECTDHPTSQSEMLVTLPVAYENAKFDTMTVNGVDYEVNLESAVDQLKRYKRLQDNWTEHNTSITVSYSPDEIPAIVEFLHKNWDSYVGVSFIYRSTIETSAEDAGYAYLPQQPVTKEAYDAYVAQLKPINFGNEIDSITAELDPCSTGACPLR